MRCTLALIVLLGLATTALPARSHPYAPLPRPAADGGIRAAEQKVLDTITRQVAAHAALKEKTDEAVAAYHASLLRAADVADALDLHRAHAEACNVLGRIHARAGHRQRTDAWYSRAVTAAGRAGDVHREMAALNGLLTMLFIAAEDDGGGRFVDLLRAYVDVATAEGRAIEVLPWLGKVLDGAPWLKAGFHATIMTGQITFGMDDIAEARLTGDHARMAEAIGKLVARDFVLTAGRLAEEIGDVPGLRAALEAHRAREDAAAEVRVGRRLIDLLPDGPEKDAVRQRTFAAALADDDLIAAAETAPDDRTAASLWAEADRRGTAARDAAADAADAADADVPDWLRDGRSPPEGDAFTEMVVHGLMGDVRYTGKLDLIRFAQADGSHAFVDPLFDLLDLGELSLAAAAALALGELAGMEDLPRILKALGHESWEVRRVMALVLGRLQAQDPDLADLLEVRLLAEDEPAVRAALRWGLLRAGRFEEHLDALVDLLRGDDPRAAATAAVALFDHGYGSAAAHLDRLVRLDIEDDNVAEAEREAVPDAAKMLGFTERPEAVPVIERFGDHDKVWVRSDAGRALNQLDSPQARDARRRRLLRRGAGMGLVWTALRDGRRGMVDPEGMAELVRRRNAANLDRYAFEADLTNWVIGESEGDIVFKIPVSNDPWTGDQRHALRGLEKRKPYPRTNRTRAGESRRVSMVHVDDLSNAVVVIDVEPVATLVDETYLTVNLNRTQRHSGTNTGLYGPLWVNFELVIEAEDALKQVRIEGLSGGPLLADNAEVPTFELPAGVTTEDVRGAELVLDFQFFSIEQSERFALGPILVLGSEIKPDLVVEKVSIDPPAPRPGAPVEVRFDVVNIGHAGAGPTHADVYAHNKLKPDGRTRIGRISIPSLAQGRRVETAMGVSVSSDLYLSDYTPGWTPEDQDTALEVVVDPDGRVEELDEDNNRSLRPITLILTEDERGDRHVDSALKKLAALTDEIDALGPDAAPDALRDALRDALEELEAVHPRTPGLDRAIKLIRMLGAQNEARARIRSATEGLVDHERMEAGDEEAGRLLGDLLRAQADLLRSGVPVSPEQIADIGQNAEMFRDQWGDDVPLFDGEQSRALEEALRSVRVRDGMREIFGEGATGAPAGEFADLVGPGLDADRRAAGEAFLGRNVEWNRAGIDLATATFHRALEVPGKWLTKEAGEEALEGWADWSTPPAETAAWVAEIHQPGDESPVTEPAEESTRSLMKRLGF